MPHSLQITKPQEIGHMARRCALSGHALASNSDIPGNRDSSRVCISLALAIYPNLPLLQIKLAPLNLKANKVTFRI